MEKWSPGLLVYWSLEHGAEYVCVPCAASAVLYNANVANTPTYTTCINVPTWTTKYEYVAPVLLLNSSTPQYEYL